MEGNKNQKNKKENQLKNEKNKQSYQSSQNSNQVSSYQHCENQSVHLININFAKKKNPQSLNYYNQKNTKKKAIIMPKEKLERFRNRSKIGKRKTQVKKKQSLIFQMSGSSQQIQLQNLELLDQYGQVQAAQIQLNTVTEGQISDQDLLFKKPKNQDCKYIYDSETDEYFFYDPLDFYKSGFEKAKTWTMEQQDYCLLTEENKPYFYDEKNDEYFSYNPKDFESKKQSTSKVDEWYNDYYYDEANDMYIPYNCDTFEKNSKQGVSKKLGVKPGDWIKTKMPQDIDEKIQYHHWIYIGNDQMIGKNHTGIQKQNINEGYDISEITLHQKGSQQHSNLANNLLFSQNEEKISYSQIISQEQISLISEEFCTQVFSQLNKQGQVYNMQNQFSEYQQNEYQQQLFDLQGQRQEEDDEFQEQERLQQRVQLRQTGNQLQQQIRQMRQKRIEQEGLLKQQQQRRKQQQQEKQSLCSQMWNSIKQQLGENVSQVIINKVLGGGTWGQALNALRQNPKKLFQFMKSVARESQKQSGITSVVTSIFNTIGGVFDLNMSSIVQRLIGKTNEVGNKAQQSVQNVVNVVNQGVDRVANNTKNVVTNTGNNTKGFIERGVEFVSNAINFIGNGISSAINFIKKIPIVQSVTSFISGAFSLVKGLFGF